MSNRQTLYLLMALVVVFAIARFWAAGRYDDYKAGLVEHKREFKRIWEMVDDLNVRRPTIVVTEDESGIRSHFQARAQTARLGVVKVQARRPRERANFSDTSYTIEFEDGGTRFTREQIANFLYNSTLPSYMPRMRTTKLSLAPSPPVTGTRSRGKLDTGDERADVWQVHSLEFTRRTPKATGDG